MKIKLKIVYLILIIFIVIIFLCYLISNFILINNNWKKFSENKEIINNSEFIYDYNLEENGKVKTVNVTLNSDILEKYHYHSYVSGDGYDYRINLQFYLFSENESKLYKIKTYFVENNDEKLHFVGHFYDSRNKNGDYKLVIYAKDKEQIYITDIIL